MKTRHLIFFVLAILSFSCNAGGSDALFSVTGFENNLKGYLFSKYENFQITKIYEKDPNKRSFLEKSLGKEVVSGAGEITAQEFSFKELHEKSGTHIGIAIIKYSTAEKSKTAAKSIEKKGYFENTIILTRYLLLNRGDQNMIVYTESAADKVVLEYLAALEKYNN